MLSLKLKGVKSDIKYLSFGNSFGTNKRKVNEDLEDPEDPEDPENICSICHLSLSEEAILTTKCNHQFHTACLCRWFNSNKFTCPNCRARFNDSEINVMCRGIAKPPPQARRKINFDDYDDPERRRILGIPPATTLTWGD